MSLGDVHLAEEVHDGGLGFDDPAARVALDAAQEGREVLGHHEHVAEKVEVVLAIFVSLVCV